MDTEVDEIRQKTPPTNGAKIRFADQEALSRAMDKLFADLGIEKAEPIGAEALQKMMAQEWLEPNELSRGIVEMRDE